VSATGKAIAHEAAGWPWVPLTHRAGTGISSTAQLALDHWTLHNEMTGGHEPSGGPRRYDPRRWHAEIFSGVFRAMR